MASDERQFQQWFVREWEKSDKWAENIHPSYGTKTGIPDVFLLVSKLIVPIELKIGELVGNKLSVSDIRPSQIRWAKKFASHGGISGLAAGVRKDKSWQIAVVHNEAWWTGQSVFDAADFVVVDHPFQAAIHVLAQ